MKEGTFNRRPYSEIMDDVQRAETPKELRKLHKELKKGYGGGFPIFMLYPNAPIIVSVITLIISVFVLIVRLWII